MAERPSDDQRNTATLAALTMILIVCGGLVGLVAFMLPDVLWFVLVPVGLGLMMVLHYFTWGRWLAASLRDQQLAEQERSPKSDTNETPPS